MHLHQIWNITHNNITAFFILNVMRGGICVPVGFRCDREGWTQQRSEQPAVCTHISGQLQASESWSGSTCRRGCCSFAADDDDDEVNRLQSLEKVRPSCIQISDNLKVSFIGSKCNVRHWRHAFLVLSMLEQFFYSAYKYSTMWWLKREDTLVCSSAERTSLQRCSAVSPDV